MGHFVYTGDWQYTTCLALAPNIFTPEQDPNLTLLFSSRHHRGQVRPHLLRRRHHDPTHRPKRHHLHPARLQRLDLGQTPELRLHHGYFPGTSMSFRRGYWVFWSGNQTQHSHKLNPINWHRICNAVSPKICNSGDVRGFWLYQIAN